jgi:hypothetical protein
MFIIGLPFYLILMGADSITVCETMFANSLNGDSLNSPLEECMSIVRFSSLTQI